MDVREIVAVISANAGDVDHPQHHTPQSVPCDYYVFNGNRLPPRLEAKIPKCFGWQLAQNYNYYLWLDGSVSLNHPDAVKWLLDNCKDMVTLKHPNHIDIRQEARYTRKGVKQKADYLYKRYKDDHVQELYNRIAGDTDYRDDKLYIGGIFMYKNTQAVRDALKDWWYYITRYSLQDQISFPYVTRKLDVTMLPDIYDESPYFMVMKHK